jgi:HEAT repeat protein/energy-coupling factor transporter ATP-binding protein EcfA2
MSDSASVFISYSTKDIHFVERLRANLKTANIPYWIDKEGLQAGTQNWEKAIRAAIRESSSVILVASPNAYESNYVQDEIAIAQISDRPIYPIFAHGDHFIECVPMGMGKTQYIDMRADRFDSNFAQLIKALGGANPSLAYVPPAVKPLAPGVTRRSPYKGLEAFQEKDAGDFFGRSTAINELLNRFRDQAFADKGRLLGVIGASGSGKSSVVMAGLLPRLKGGALPGSESWLYVPLITPGNMPIRALTRGLSKVFPDKSFGAIEDDLRRPNGLGLANLAYTVDQRVVLYIDQFEELFMPGISAEERDQYISMIVQAVNEPGGNLVVLLTLRADFYDRPTNYRELGRLISQYNFTLLPMSLTELREAVENPANLPDVGLQFEAGLVGDIVFELRESKDRMALAGALPLLQFTLQQLYERRDQSSDVHILTHAAYQEIGGVSGAISRYAEAVFSELDQDAQNRMGRVFFRLINVDERGEATRERARLSDFEGDEASVRLINALVSARLLLANRDEDLATLEVAHEALLRHWHRLIKWIESASEGKHLLHKLEVDADYWSKRGKPKDHFRYMHEQEKEIEVIRVQWELQFDSLVKEFLEPEIERLIQDLESRVYQRAEISRERLYTIGSDAVPALLVALGLGGGFVRRQVVDLLGRIGDNRALEDLIRILHNKSEFELRPNVLKAIGQMRDARALDTLVEYLGHDELDVRKAAKKAIENMAGETTVKVLIAALEHMNMMTRIDAAEVLGRLRNTAAVEPLILALQQGNLNVQMRVVVALGELEDDRAIDALIKAFANSDWILKNEIIKVLWRFGDERAKEVFVKGLSSPSGETRSIALEALGKLGVTFPIEDLVPFLSSPDWYVRLTTVTALGNFVDNSRVQELLASMLTDPDPVVRVRARMVLGEK